jgi:multicomponent Na+:H+ antiporter subunit D
MESVLKLPFLCIIGTLVAAFCMPVLARWKKDFCAPLATLVTGIVFVTTIVIAYHVMHGEPIRYAVSGWAPPWGIEIVVESLSSMMLMLLSGICFLILIFSFPAIKHELEKKVIGWYYTAFLLTLAGMMGLVISNDIFNFYVFIEVTGLGACSLVAAKGTRQATEAALKYLLLATIGSGFILFGIGFLYMITGHLNLTYIAQELPLVKDSYPFLIWTALSFFTVGFGVKSALFPLHLWLPDAHSSAPSPSSAVLSSLVVKVYIVAFLKDITDSIRARYIPRNFYSSPDSGSINNCYAGWLLLCFRPDRVKKTPGLFNSGPGWLRFPGHWPGHSLGIGSRNASYSCSRIYEDLPLPYSRSFLLPNRN